MTPLFFGICPKDSKFYYVDSCSILFDTTLLAISWCDSLNVIGSRSISDNKGKLRNSQSSKDRSRKCINEVERIREHQLPQFSWILSTQLSKSIFTSPVHILFLNLSEHSTTFHTYLLSGVVQNCNSFTYKSLHAFFECLSVIA